MERPSILFARARACSGNGLVRTCPDLPPRRNTGGAKINQTDTTGAKLPVDKFKTVNCCVKGQCKQVGSELDCAKIDGKVVKDCKECK